MAKGMAKQKGGSKSIDHDRLFKRLLRLCFIDFLKLFLPEVLAYLDVSSLVFTDKEILRKFRRGRKREGDLVVKARYREQVVWFLFHVEAQARKQNWSTARMFEYFAALTLEENLPVYPIVILSFASPREPQPQRYVVEFPDRRVLEFHFAAIQLNLLNWRDYLHYNNPVAAALMTQMGVKREEFVKVRAECARMLGLVQGRLDEVTNELLYEFVDTYLPLTDEEQKQLQAEIAEFRPPEKEATMRYLGSWGEMGRKQGLVEGKLEIALMLLEQKFGALSKITVERINHLTADQLDVLLKLMLSLNDKAELTAWLGKQDAAQNGAKKGAHSAAGKTPAKSNGTTKRR